MHILNVMSRDCESRNIIRSVIFFFKKKVVFESFSVKNDENMLELVSSSNLVLIGQTKLGRKLSYIENVYFIYMMRCGLHNIINLRWMVVLQKIIIIIIFFFFTNQFPSIHPLQFEPCLYAIIYILSIAIKIA